MPLSPGDKFGPYLLIAPIGKGGMGEVWKARDTRLDRVVAMKFSEEKFSERFEREAKAIAALNHSNICHLYDVGPNYLVMELIEGQPIKGPLPVEKAVEYAGQILEALDHAHRKGIMHRDLKPANILLTKQGIKLLDFGLAKLNPAPLKETDATLTQALTKPLTRDGQILGTLQYMSPEQLQGKEADARSDLFSFGCVLYEMLTGKRAFDGSSAASVIAAILERPAPSISAIAPPALDRVLKTCVAKDPDNRWQTARDVRRAIELATDVAVPSSVASKSKRWIATSTGALFFLVFGVFLFVRQRENTPAIQSLQFEIAPPEGGRFTAPLLFAISPDGRRLAFQAAGKDGIRRIWVHNMDSAQSHPLAGTEGVNIAPWWSPDSRFLAYLDKQRHIVQMDATGGPPEEVCDLRSVGTAWHGGSWNKESGMILGLDGMFRCSTTNGVLTRLTTVEQSRNELFHGRPVPLPDGRHFLYMRYSRDAEMTGIYVGSLDSKPDVQDRHLLFPTQFGTAYAPSQDPLLGHVLFLRGTALMAQPFDVRRLRLTGEAERVAEAVGNNGNVFGFFSAADNGTLSYRRTASADSQLTWFDRQGKQLSEVGEPAPYQYVRLSPDGTRAARGLLGGFLLNPDIWLLEFARGVSTRFTFGNNTKADPVWSPDGAHIAFYRGRDLYQKASNGAGDEELLVKSAESKRPTSWSSDGRFLLYDVLDPHTKYDLWMLPLQGGREPFPILHSEFNEGSGRLSPGMQWLAYQSDESGTNEIYIRPLNFSVTNTVSLGEGKTLISKGGGIRPVWRGDGRELYYQAPDRKVMAVEIGSGPALQAGIPQPLFQVPDAETAWDVSMDGKRFLLPVPVTQSAQTPITVVLNWQAGLKK